MTSPIVAIADQAKADVSKAFPPPKFEPVPGASYAALGAFACCSVCCFIAGLGWLSPKAIQGISITTALAWVVAYLPLRNQAENHSRAVSKRFRELRDRAENQKTLGTAPAREQSQLVIERQHPMRTNTTDVNGVSIYAPGEVLTREVTAQQFVAEYAPHAVELFSESDAAYRDIEEEAHAEARRLALPISPVGRYPVIVWDVAWARQGF